MHRRHILMASVSALVLHLAAAHQGRATVILDHGSKIANPAVESGGHRLAKGTAAPVNLLLTGFDLSPSCCLCPWDMFAVPALPRPFIPARWPVILRTPNGKPFLRLER
jgi:hypothetical protein